ncbi:MAG: flagellar basal body P-ring protein FlgI [Thermodesulfobacteriota bacterium]
MRINGRSAIISTVLLLTCLLPVLESTAHGARLKDLASIKGTRSNQLVGYGLVVGLDGTGDGSGTKFTVQSLINMMERLGIHALPGQVKVANVAAVMITADLPPFARVGSEIDVMVSSVGDAESLQGGTLLLSPLKGADNNIYALAQGPLLLGGFSAAGAAGGGVQKNHPTVARIPGGATIEREIPFQFNTLDELTISLNNPDFTTALRVAGAINREIGPDIATPTDAGTVRVQVPESSRGNLVPLVAGLEQIDVKPDNSARIVLAERTGTVVMGDNVRIAPVAIAHGNLSVQIKERKDVSQPLPFARGETVVTDDTELAVTEERQKLLYLSEGANLGEVVNALNAIGVSPRDLITVLQAIRASGALYADLDVI